MKRHSERWRGRSKVCRPVAVPEPPLLPRMCPGACRQQVFPKHCPTARGLASHLVSSQVPSGLFFCTFMSEIHRENGKKKMKLILDSREMKRVVTVDPVQSQLHKT